METRRLSLDDLLNNDVIENDQDDNRCRWCDTPFQLDEPRCRVCRMPRKYRTMSEMGPVLPIGVKTGATYNRSFEAVPITFAIERDIRRKWGGTKNITVSDYTATILAFTIKTVGGVSLASKSYDHKLLIFSQMYQADVLYMYAYVRYLSLGSQMTIKGVQCPKCRREFDFPCDISTMEIVELSPDLVEREIVLEHGFRVGDKVKKKLKVGPPMWFAWGNREVMNNPTALDLFAAMFSSGVISIEDTPDGITISDSEMMQLSKVDIDICESEFGRLVGGPQWEVSGNCPACGGKFFFSLDWSYDNFFSRSYRSRVPKS